MSEGMTKEDVWDVMADRIIKAQKEYFQESEKSEKLFQKYLAQELRRAYNAGLNHVRESVRQALGLDDVYEEKDR
jgi:hypothetical protein